MTNEKIIGIVGGVGPFAGFDLCQKIHDQTNAQIDQEHLAIALLSMPGQISDRTGFLLGRTNTNPANSIAVIIKKLETLGAGVIGIPCNASHAPQIFEVVLQELKKARCRVKLLHMIDEVAVFITTNFPHVKNVGILSVNGTYKSGIYQSILEDKGFLVTMPDQYIQKYFVHQAIYDPDYGIKAHSNPPTVMAKELLYKAIDFLRAKNVDAIVLGCTEIPLAITEKTIGNVMVIDTNQVLARALVREAAPEKLKPLDNVMNYEVVS